MAWFPMRRVPVPAVRWNPEKPPKRHRAARVRRQLRRAGAVALVVVTAVSIAGPERMNVAGSWLISRTAEAIVSPSPRLLALSAGPRLLTAEGATLASFPTRLEVPLAEVPRHVRLAVLAAEDTRFYDHAGVNPAAIGKAAGEYVTGKRRRGASTITQQLAKLDYVGNAPTLGRKFEEVAYAGALEDRYTKDQLLEQYLNRVYFGHGAYGIAAAAQLYFGRGVADLDVAQAATLAGLIRLPSSLDPYTAPRRVVTRRNQVLDSMAAQGWIDRGTLDAARQAALIVVPHADVTAVSHLLGPFLDYARAEALTLPALGATRGERSRRWDDGGLVVQTTLSESALDTAVASLGPLTPRPPTTVAVVAPGGAVRALVNASSSVYFDIATQGYYTVGATLAPIAAAIGVAPSAPGWTCTAGYAALSFDDGPDPSAANNTQKIVSTLAAFGAHATFFEVGDNVAAHPQLTRAVAAAGDVVGNHSYTHPVLADLDHAQVVDEFTRTSKAISAAGAPAPSLFRPPDGSTSETVRLLAESARMTETQWNVDPRDYEAKSARAIVDSVTRNMRSGSIILLHDGYTRHTTEALPSILRAMQSKGLCPGLIERSTIWNEDQRGYTDVVADAKGPHIPPVPDVLSAARQAGLAVFPASRNGCGAALSPDGASALEQAAFHAALRDGGRYDVPYVIERVLDRQGRVLYQRPAGTGSPPTLPTARVTAALATLQSTANQARVVAGSGWAVGSTSADAVAVWVDPTNEPGGQAAPAVFDRITAGLQNAVSRDRQPQTLYVPRPVPAAPAPKPVATVQIKAPDASLPVAQQVRALLGQSTATRVGALVEAGDADLVAVNADSEFPAASTRKLATASTALAALGPDFRFLTDVVATSSLLGGTLGGDVYLVAGGDPVLATDDLRTLAAQVRSAGVERVDGDLVLDETRYRDWATPRGWESDMVPTQLGPPSAFVVDRNRTECDRQFVADPGAANAQRFAEALADAGVVVTGAVRTGRAPSGTRLVARHASPRLAQILPLLLKPSDSLIAEELLLEVGREGGNATTAGGLAAAAKVADERHLPQAEAVDGSGLSRLDVETPRRQLTRLHVVEGWQDFPALYDALSIACGDGTLQQRMCGTPAAGVVRAKTGTLAGVVNLVGYATVDNTTVRFAFLLDGVKSSITARNAVDAAVVLIVKRLSAPSRDGHQETRYAASPLR